MRSGGLSALAVSAVALACTSGAVVTLAQPLAVAVPAVPVAILDEDARAQELSRSENREELALAEERQDAITTQLAAVDAEEQRIAAEREAQRLAEEQAAAERQAFIAANGYDPDESDPREIARQMMANVYGWGSEEFSCYDEIIVAESNWNPLADNPISSAYGIPQALPGKKMASAGDDWETNPATQIEWGLGYVKDVYGTPCKTLAFRRVHNWY